MMGGLPSPGSMFFRADDEIGIDLRELAKRLHRHAADDPHASAALEPCRDEARSRHAVVADDEDAQHLADVLHALDGCLEMEREIEDFLVRHLVIIALPENLCREDGHLEADGV